ncbi:MAG: AmmeMemoRadiSam system protein B [Elusimicrobiota bacterium]
MPFLDLNSPLPALRQALEAVPIQEKGQDLFLIRDLENLTPQSLALSQAGLALASLLDGTQTGAMIQGVFLKETGRVLKPEELLGLVEQLDAALLLETPQVMAKRRRILKDFLDNPLRPAAFAGLSYPKEPLELTKMLGGFMKDGKGPGKDPDPAPLAAPPRGLISPHIDFPRGGPAYAWAYQALSESRPPDLIVALGVAHASPDSPWALTKKAYETPHGPMAVDEGLYEDFRKTLWYDPLADEPVHRTEHSLEFQAVWLRWLWREKTPPWLPVLCSTFERYSPDQPPSGVPMVEKAIAQLETLLRERAKKGQRIMILAGVDLAHVGRRFGDELDISPELEKKIEGEDRASMEHALKLDADAFYRSVVAGGHWRKVCGLSALYTSLRLIKALGPGSGKLLAYGQAPDPSGGLVSFTGAIFP